MFGGDGRSEARDLLVEDCAELPGWHLRTPEGLERVRFAVLKLSGGTIAGLVDAICLAQTDWRDALVAAGFGYDVSAHEAWWPGTQESPDAEG
jgi:hypothetical protein